MANNQALPAPNLPLLDATGKLNPIWYQFFNSLWQRTGGGSSAGSVQSITVNGGSGILSSVTNPTTTTEINLSLGDITPNKITAAGQIEGTTGYFLQGLSNFGQMQFGSKTTASVTASGYISILDINGNVQNLLVQ